MADTVSDLARRLAENAEAVCRYYLSNGRRHGSYWIAGDVHNAPGRSLYVRLRGPSAGKGAAGKWTDAAEGTHGDLLDLIAAAQGLHGGDLLDEARRFLGLVRAPPAPPALPPTPAGSAEAARRLFAMARPIGGTLAETYLRERGIADWGEADALRFHPRCWYRPDPETPDGARDTWPALLAAVTDSDGELTGVQRTYLDPSGRMKAPVVTPRRAMGHLLGNAVRWVRPATACRRRDGRRRGHRDDAVLAVRPALPAARGRTLGRPPRRPAVPSRAAPALPRPRQRPGRTLGGGKADGPGCMRPGSRRWCWHPHGATGTTICSSSGPARWRRHCEASSPRRT